jgi:ABC-type uncharacterized transport system permease subunit
MPTGGQIVLLLLAVAVFVIGALASLSRRWINHTGANVLVRGCLVGGLGITLIVLVWHAVGRHDWVPIGDNFDALLWLAVLLSLFVIYIQGSTRMGGVDGFVMPVVIVLMLAAAYFGTREYQEYHPLVRNIWSWAHRVTAYGGAAAFTVAAAGGAVYMLKSRRLRRKEPLTPRWGSLEGLEALTVTGVNLGFALLTIGLITGVVLIVADHQRTSMTKLVMACAAWLVYATVLHTPINPRLRGRKTAMLSIAGFALIAGAVVAAQFAGGGS